MIYKGNYRWLLIKHFDVMRAIIYIAQSNAASPLAITWLCNLYALEDLHVYRVCSYIVAAQHLV